MAGKHQGNVFASLMSNFDTAREALEVSANSAGSAMQEHAKWSESLEARLLKLKATWQSLAQSFMKSDFLKGLLNGVTGLANGLDKLINTFGTLPTLLMAFTAFKSFSGGGFFRTIKDEATGAATGITNVFKQSANSINQSLSSINVKTGFRGFLDDNDVNSLRNYSNALNKGVSSGTAWNNCMANASDAAKDVARSNEFLAKSHNGNIEGLNGYIKAQQKAEVSTIAQNKSLTNARAIIKEYQSGCKTSGMSQKEFADAVSKTNPHLANAMTTTNSLNGAMKSYITSMIGAKAANIALQAATMAFNMLLTMAVTAAVSFVIKKFDEWIVTSEELAEKVDEVTEKFKQQQSELVKGKASFESEVSKYEKLSKGVDSLGENVSLTASEYEEYKSVVASIADQVPELVSGYDSQGNAILNCAGNVDVLTAAYENLIRAQNEEVLKNADDIEKDFKNEVEKANKKTNKNDLTTDSKEALESMLNGVYTADEITEYFAKNGGNTGGVNGQITGARRSEIVKAIQDANLKVLDENGKEFDLGTFYTSSEADKYIAAAVKQNGDAIRTIISDFDSTLEAEAEGMKTIAQAVLSDAFDISDSDYANMSEKMQNVARQMISNFDAEQYADILDSGKTTEEYIYGILDAFNELDASGQSKSIEAVFDLQTKFNSGEASYGEYVDGLRNANELIDSLDVDKDVKNNIKLALNTDEVIKEYDTLKKRLTSDEYDIQMKTEDAQKFLDSLTASEYAVFVDLVASGEIDLSDFDVASLREYIENQAKLQEAMNFTIAMDVETESVEALNTAMAESVSATGLSSASINTLKSRYAELAEQGYDLSAMFEETANGIHLNRNAVNEFEQALASQKLSEIGDENSGHLGVLKDRYDELTEEIKNCTDAGERANLYSEQQQVARKINDLATLASQYKGLTSAYNAWQNAESAGNERDMYENIISGFETVEDELSRGWVDDGTIKFLELMSGKTDLATKSASELKEEWKKLDQNIANTGYSIKDFFTVDDDGNSTSTGVYNFLKAVETLEKSDAFKGKEGIDKLIQRDDDGNIISFDFQVAGGDKAIADTLGISEELVQIMKRAADDAGFVVTLDGKWTQLADLKTSAEESENALKKLKTNGLDALKDFDDKDLDFNFDANSLESLNGELEKAMNVLDKFRNKDGTINMKMDGAEEALEIASYFTATIDKLTEPVYMQLETNQVEEELQEPLTKMQEFERLSKEKHQLELTGDTKGLKDVEKEMNEIVDYIYENDDLKAKLEIEGLSKEEIKAKLEKGEIEIPATVDIQLEMSEDIKDMRLLMMQQLGLVSEYEVKLKVGYEIDDSVVDKLDDEEKEVVVKYIEENPEAWDKLSDDEKEVYIEFIKKGNIEWFESLEDKEQEVVIKYVQKGKKFEELTDKEQEVLIKLIGDDSELKDWTAPQKEAMVKYLVDDGYVGDWSPEEKQAFAKYLVDGGDVEGWSPEAKDAFVKYLVDGGDPDKFDPENKESWVVYDTDTTKPDNYNADKDATVTYDKNSSVPDNYNADKDGTVTYDKNSNAVDKWNPDKNGTVKFDKDTSVIDKWKPVVSGIAKFTLSMIIPQSIRTALSKIGISIATGTANVDGTAFSNGTATKLKLDKKSGKAYKQGDWGVKKTTNALTGELGQELVVYKNRYWTVGDTGAEFANIPKGAIVFNHQQTKEIFKNGKVTSGGGRGRVFASGTAFADGTESKTVVVGRNKNTGKTYTKTTGSDSDNDFEETIDLIEIAISRIERAIDKLDLKANSVYKSWSGRNSALSEQISEIGNEITLQQKAANEYLAAANGVGLPSDWIDKIKNGQVDITTIKDEVLAEKIKDYQTYYELYLDCIDAAEELKETESELYAQRFENVQTQYDAILQGYEHTESMLNEYISQAEAKGYIVSKKYYANLIANEKQNINTLKQEQMDLIKSRDEAVESGKIAKYSEEWYNMCAEIDSVTQAIEEGTTALLEYDNAIREIDWSVFDLIQERISAVSEEADFLIELMSNEKLFDDKGKLTSQGVATMGLHAQKYNDYMYQADEYGEEVSNLNSQIAKDPYDQELINRRNELIELQRESILAAEDEKEAIRDMVEEGINLELDALQELIDKKNEELESEKDLYEYQKKVKEQTEEIASLEKQMSAYSGDDSEEAKAKIQELKISFEEAKTDLEETEYDKYISDTSALLDTLYLEYENILNQRLDNVDFLLQQVVDGINASMGVGGTIDTALSSEGAIAQAIANAVGENGSIKNILNAEATGVGTTLSSTMSNIWSVGDGNIKSVLSTYGKGFQDKQTTTNLALDKIKADVGAMVDDIDKDAKKKVSSNKTSTSAKKNPSNGTFKKVITNNKITGIKESSSGDGKPKVGDKVKFVSGQYYYDSQGKKPLGSHYQGKEVYITNINERSWATHPYHISTGKKLGSGDLGWLKLNQLSGYSIGKKDFLNNEIAWTQENNKREFIVRPSDGAILTPIAKGDSVLNANASRNIWDMANSPIDFIKNNLGLDNANIPSGANVNNNVTQNFENVVFSMPNVHGYNELLSQMQKDKNFEKLILSMSIDRLAGKSSLAKNKAIR